MTMLKLIACVGIVFGCFTLLDLGLLEFANEIFAFLQREKSSVKRRVLFKQGKLKKGFFRRQIEQSKNVLEVTGKGHKFELLCTVSLVLLAVGAALAILLENVFLVPIFSVGFMLLPFWYVKLIEANYKKDISMDLETALSIITTAYLRTENIVRAIEENVKNLNPPVKNVFEEFLTQVKYVNPNEETAIKAMKARINNEVFREWCDAVVMCVYDRNLKSTLVPIVSKLSDMRTVNAELSYLIFEPFKEFIIMVMLVIANVPIMYFLNKDWYGTLMHTAAGQVVLSICAAAIFVCMAFAINLTRPIEYRR